MAKQPEASAFIPSSSTSTPLSTLNAVPTAEKPSLTFVDIAFSTSLSKKQQRASAKAEADNADPESGPASGTKTLLHPVTGQVQPGHMLAVMGPSGAGKTTLLDALARRLRGAKGEVYLGDRRIDTTEQMGTVASYVEQEDDLLSVLTVRETILFAARLSNPADRVELLQGRVDHIITVMGLAKCANTIIGNPIQKGISGGQKRRVTIAQSLVTNPSILFLDEPTSGLDTTTSREVMSAIKRIAQETSMIVVATIHQPNFETLSLFDELLVLAEGKTMYFGSIDGMPDYFDTFGAPIPRFANPADHAIDLINADFELATESNIRQTIASLSHFYHNRTATLTSALRSSLTKSTTAPLPVSRSQHRTHFASHTAILSHRIFLTYTRNLIAYGVRLGMYIGMGIMMALIWLRLGDAASTVNDRLSVHFFAVAFLSFMSVAGIPAFLEERAVFLREARNGLYSAAPYALASSLVTAPFLAACAVCFAACAYYAVGLNPPASKFFQFVAYLFLATYAAESQVVLVASALPIFVAALAIASFANGFWMCVQGYFIRAISLPRFWRYSFHYADYQKYAFELLVNNDFDGIVFDCGRFEDGSCRQCSYPSSAPEGSCLLYGEDVLAYLEVGGVKYWEWIVILLGISLVLRMTWYVVLARSK